MKKNNTYKEDDLRVLMLGGRRCGKTSVLSSMFDSIINGVSNRFITVTDATTLAVKGIERQDSLNAQTAELKDMLAKSNTATFLVDKYPTKEWWDYRLKIQIKGSNRCMYINFADVPGEYYRQGNDREQEVKDYVAQCDVFVIAIDTPYLMESSIKGNVLCTDGINELVNRVGAIQEYLTYIDDEEGKNDKMVVFCPVKCEKWYNEGRIHEVCERVKEVYSTCITNLCSYSRMDISILPLLTAGNIEFVEQKEAYVLKENTPSIRYVKIRKEGVIRCCQQSESILRLIDGQIYRKKDGDKINEDPEAVITDSNLIRPCSWFKIRYNEDSKNDGYKPLNCEQLPLHIIRFMLNKINYGINHPSGFWNKIKIWLLKTLGTINLDELENVVREMQQAGVFNDNQDDGIIHIKTIQ